MAYQNSTATGQTDLLDKLATFLGGVSGWTVEMNASAPDNGSDKQVIFSHVRDSITWYYTLVSRTAESPNRIDGGAATGINTGNSIYNQPGTFATSELYAAHLMMPFSGSVTYYFFATAQYVYVAVRISDYFQYIGFGQLTLNAGYTKGIYLIGSKDTFYGINNDYNSSTYHSPLGIYINTLFYGSGYIRLSDDTWNKIPLLTLTNTSTNLQNTFQTDFPSFNIDNGIDTHPLAITNVLIPSMVFPPHPSLSNKRTFAGYMEDLYVTASENLLLPTEITIGADTFTLLPFWKLGNRNTSFAFKKT